jgi:thiol:disulfide interchange protein DsbG
MTDRRSFLALAAATVALPACKDKPAAETPASPPATSPREVYEIAAGGHGFAIGPVMAANTVYVFFDTQCPHCAQLWSNAKPLLGKLKMMWLPVALLGPASLAQGATILSAGTPVDAMEQNEALVLARKGGITANPSLPTETLDKVKANTALFSRTGADSVPLIVFKNAKTGTYGSHAGAVSTDQLASMAGV